MPTQFETFKDLSITFKKHPVTDDLVTVKDKSAIAQSITNLLMTRKGERPFQPTLGSGLDNILFEPLDYGSAAMIKSRNIKCLSRYEPRINVKELDCQVDFDNNGYNVEMQYKIVGRDRQTSGSRLLSRAYKIMPYTQVSNLDFEEIKTQLKEYMRSQSDFTDYDFEGSALATLIDTLAYNTYYTAFNTNMVVNELFIDSATLRDNVVAIAKQLGYRPKSATSPTAYVSFTVNYTNATTDKELILQERNRIYFII